MSKWRLSFDLRNVKALLWAYAGVFAYTLWGILFNVNGFSFSFREPYYIMAKDFYLLADFIMPILMMFTVLLLFSEDFGKGSWQFISSLPVSRLRFLLVRYLRVFMLLFTAQTALLFIFVLRVNNALGTVISLPRILSLTAPTAMFLMALALFSIVMTRRAFYGIIICGGYVLVDASSTGNFFGGHTIFISMYVHGFSPGRIVYNRTLFFVLSLVLVFLACLIFRSKIYARALKRTNL
ncbi:MAG: hypothetical protein LBR85_03600 [Oscillospiraceae bacterium]|jgi:hypothetical protein|nr:hypothetical protein [Oscillospiraceae bacterium]